MRSLLRSVLKMKRQVKLGPREVFHLFREVLKSNSEALEIITDMGEKLGGDYIFDDRYIQTSVNDLKSAVFQSLNLISELSGESADLREAYSRITARIDKVLNGEEITDGPRLIWLDEVSSDFYDIVGGKSARLAAMIRHLNVSIPPAFCLTTLVYRDLIKYNGLEDLIKQFESNWLVDDAMITSPIRQQIIDCILSSSAPPGLIEEISQFINKLKEKKPGKLKFAVRSSACDEDMEFSFAGQFQTELAIRSEENDVYEAYRKVVASMFSQKALDYRKRFFPDMCQSAIACCCQINIDSMVSGVLYTRDISDPGASKMFAVGSWGQGVRLVEGRVPTDTFLLNTSPQVSLDKLTVQNKLTGDYLSDGEGIVESAIEPNKRNVACLTESQIIRLGNVGLTIENYFGRPQDIEWCIGPSGDLYVLQSRPLQFETPVEGKMELMTSLSNYPVLLENAGIVARHGIASGKVYIASSMDSLKEFPNGAILVSSSDSSRFVRVMHKAAAIITEVGTPVSHMATLCREFHVPCMVNMTGILSEVQNGMEITLDTEDRKIYQGRIPELMAYQAVRPDVHEASRETSLLRRLIDNISRLHLVDPLMGNYHPGKCRTYHDLLRYIHEKAVQAMVDIGKNDRTLLRHNLVRPLNLPIQTGILVIDIDDGVSASSAKRKLSYDDIQSVPFKAILDGMLSENVWHQAAMPVSFRDLVNSMLSVPSDLVDGHYTGHNIAVVSRNYVNLCFRFGYHFNIIDAYCDDVSRKNHIYFRFLGGATDIAKRSRRARLIGRILADYDFRIETKGDLVIARMGNKVTEQLEMSLNTLGRLIGFTRQLDVRMETDQAIDRYHDAFLNGNYNFSDLNT